MLPLLTELVTEIMTRARIERPRFKVELAEEDPDRQSILFTYPSVGGAGDYFRSAILIEAGARSALDPHADLMIRPYIADDYLQADLTIGGITTVHPGRTFWDKIVLLHGQRQAFEAKGRLRHDGNRVSRHYYDVHRLRSAEDVETWPADAVMRESCVRHARMFFTSPSDRLDLATPGSFTLVPSADMREILEADYERMRGMIFGTVPVFDQVVASIEDLENRVNG